MNLSKLLARARVIATSFVAYAAALAAGLMLAAGQIAETAPEGHEGVTRWLLVAVAVLGEVVAVVRRHTPVPPSARGVLMPAGVELIMHSDSGDTIDVEVKDRTT